MSTDILFLIPVLIIATAVLLLWLTRRKREILHIPSGEAVYQDTQEQRGTILFSDTHKLKGRPDFLFKQGDLIIPVEVKTSRTPREPHYSHLMQLIAYCVLVEENYGVRPSHGVIRYTERQFEIPFTA